MPAPSEQDAQRAFMMWFEGVVWEHGPLKGQWKSPPHKTPGVVCWHTPNSGEGRDAAQGLRLKQAGVKAGIHDLLFLWGGLYGMEWKKPGGLQPPSRQLSDSQKRMHPQLMAAGMVASCVVDNLRDAKAFVIKHGLALSSCQ